MLLNQRELRYRSIKYSVSSSQLLKPIKHTNKTDQRHSLTKENLKTQPSHKPSPFFKQNSTHHATHFVATRSNFTLNRKELPVQSNLKCTQATAIEDVQPYGVLPYIKHYEQLQSICQPFSGILSQSSFELKTIRKQLQLLTSKVQQQLREMQQLMAVESRALVRQMQLSLKQHNKVAVNARDRVEMTSQIYQQTKSRLMEMSASLDDLEIKYNS